VKSAAADPPARSFAFGRFTLAPSRQLLLRDGQAVRIGGRALDILTTLVERPGEVVTKSELFARVWPDTTVDESNLKVNMAALRRVLEHGPNAPQCIATVVGRGYRFVAPLQTIHLVDAPHEKPRPNHNLPTLTTKVFGRAEAIDALGRDLEQSRLVSIVGPGGVGKTTVAICVAEAASEAFGDGVCFVDLAPLSDADRTPHTIAAALDLQTRAQDALATLCAFLQNRQVLVVLDNCEHVIDAVASCADRMLASAAGVKILVTSREPLRIAKERVRRLPGLSTPPESQTRLDARSALDFPAVALFVERATDSQGSFQLSDAEAPHVAQICRRLDGLAIAIELAAARVGTFGVSGLLRQLDDRFHLLSGWRAGPERQRTLAATLDWSYSLLADREASLLRAISVFAAVFDLAGATAVSTLSGGSGEVLEGLASLATKSLLTVEPDGDGVRCRLLETTRAYSLERLRSCGEEHATRERHALHIAAVLERAQAEWPRRSAREWGAAYGPTVDDLRAALAWAQSDAANRSLLLRLTVAGTLLWNHLSLTDECRTYVARAIQELEAAGLVGTHSEMRLRMALAITTMWTCGPSPEVLIALRRTLEIADQVGDVDHRLRSLRTIGSFHAFNGQYTSAIRGFEMFASVAAERDPSALADGESHLSMSELLSGKLESARRRVERLQQRSMLGVDDARLARFLSDRNVDVGVVLSCAQWLTGSPDTAAQTAEATVKQAHSVKHGLSLSNALAVGACPVFFKSRRYDECARYLVLLEQQVHQRGIIMWSPTARFYRGALACAQDNVPASGVQELERAVEEHRAIHHWARMPWVLAVLADALGRSGHFAEATARIAEAIEWGRAHDERWAMPEVLRIQAAILSAQGRSDAAESVLLDAISIARDIGALSWRLRAASDLARLFGARMQWRHARELLAPIYAEFSEGFASRDLVDAAELIATATRAGHR
jgi:predicted ATPase/DNA-binding winged helix-turn-helix (wHTH) protein